MHGHFKVDFFWRSLAHGATWLDKLLARDSWRNTLIPIWKWRAGTWVLYTPQLTQSVGPILYLEFENYSVFRRYKSSRALPATQHHATWWDLQFKIFFRILQLFVCRFRICNFLSMKLLPVCCAMYGWINMSQPAPYKFWCTVVPWFPG